MRTHGSVVVQAEGLTKRFGQFTAVDGISVEIGEGESFGFLGPNGAGKTSTMRMIATVSPVSSGRLRVLGRDPAHDGPTIRARLGVVPQEDTLDIELGVRQNITQYGRYFGLSRKEARLRADELLAFVQLDERAQDKVDTLSGGMKRRLTIARALVNEPELVLLDEPTTGLDPQARHLLWERLYRLKDQGRTLIITTHYMDEAEQLCDRLVIMDQARIVDGGTPRELIDRHATREVVEVRGLELDQVQGLCERIEELADRLLLCTDNGDAVVAALHERSLEPRSVLVRRSGLEDVFLRLTGRTLVD